MKRLLMMLIILFSIYLGIQFAFKFFGNGHTINYQIKNGGDTFDVEEVYTLNRKDEMNNYYFKVKVNLTTFSFQTYENFNRSDMILKRVRYFKDDKYECLLPIFRNDKIIFDFMCMQGNVITYYHDLIGKDETLDEFVSGISEKNYNVNNWKDDKSNQIGKAPITVYPNNILDNHFIGINNYKGIYTINNLNLKKIADVKIFNKDIYERKLSAIIGKYYVTADYELDNEFNRFYVIDLTSNSVSAARGNQNISYDTYIQGIVGNSLYLFDRESKKQFELDAKAKSLLEVGNLDTGIKYYDNGKWERVSAENAAKTDLLFNYPSTTIDNPNYDRADKVGNKLSGYYYYYKKKNDIYNVYRANVQDPDVITYLFSTSEINSIKYVYDFVYYSENNEVKYYEDKTGIKTVVKDDEFEFNKSLFYNIYLK